VINSFSYAEAIFQTVREPLLVLDADLRVKSASRSYYLKTKSTPEQTVGRTMAELGSGQWNVAALQDQLRQVITTDQAFNDLSMDVPFPVIGKRSMVLNGRRLVAAEAEESPAGKMILLAMEDVTERLRVEGALAREQAWFRVTLGSIGDAVIATDNETRITYMNATAEKLTAWPLVDAMGRPLVQVFNIVNEETHDSVESPVVKALRLGVRVGLGNHTLLLARDGTERPIDDSAAPIRDAQGDVLGVVLIFHDVSDRRRTDHLMQVSEIRYRRLFEAAHDGILIVDPYRRQRGDLAVGNAVAEGEERRALELRDDVDRDME